MRSANRGVPSSIRVYTMIRFSPIFRFPSMPSVPNLSRIINPLSSSSISSCAKLYEPTSLKTPKTPLFLRPRTHSERLSELKKWHDWAKTLAYSVGSSFIDSDDGPDCTLLLRELKWLVEDAFEDPTLIHQEGSQTARLRASLDELFELWRERIEGRRPFQYVVGCEHWRDLVLSVEEGVLIPRPETELIVDLVEGLVSGDSGFREGVWADMGTGSGALAIGIGKILGGNGKVIATDLSHKAIAVAEYNVKRYGLQEVVAVRQGSWFEPLKDMEGRVAGIVSNPPYIPSEDIPGLQAEVARHEPKLALDGGANGMDCLLHLCRGAASMLKAGGFFAFETNGEKQCKFLVDYMVNEPASCFRDVRIVPDLAGIQRFVTGFHR